PHARTERSRRPFRTLIVGQALSPANVLGNPERVRDCPIILLERKFDSLFLFASYEFVSLNDAGAGVPPQNRIVVTRRAERFGFFEPVHCLAQKIVSLKTATRGVLPQFRFCAAFGDGGSVKPLKRYSGCDRGCKMASTLQRSDFLFNDRQSQPSGS